MRVQAVGARSACAREKNLWGEGGREAGSDIQSYNLIDELFFQSLYTCTDA